MGLQGKKLACVEEWMDTINWDDLLDPDEQFALDVEPSQPSTLDSTNSAKPISTSSQKLGRSPTHESVPAVVTADRLSRFTKPISFTKGTDQQSSAHTSVASSLMGASRAGDSGSTGAHSQLSTPKVRAIADNAQNRGWRRNETDLAIADI